MTPAARLQMAIEILEGLERTAQPTDRFLKAWFRTRRFAGSKDRRAIAEQVFSVQRHRAHLTRRMGGDVPRALVIASLLETYEDVTALFSGGYGPAPLTDAERAAMAATQEPAPAWVLGEYPSWLEAELLRAFGDGLPQAMAALIPRAPTDLRVNTLKAARDDVIAALAEQDIAAAPTPYAPHGVRIAGDVPNLSKSPLFESGAFEFQDEAAQIASHLCDAKPGMRVLDLAAGAGGKSLALAAAMRNTGEIVACDVRGEALFELEKRAVRAGVTIIKTVTLEHAAPEGAFRPGAGGCALQWQRHLAAPARAALAPDAGPACGTDRGPGQAAGSGGRPDRPGRPAGLCHLFHPAGGKPGPGPGFPGALAGLCRARPAGKLVRNRPAGAFP